MNDVRASGFSLCCQDNSMVNFCIVYSPVVTMTHPICRFPWMEPYSVGLELNDIITRNILVIRVYSMVMKSPFFSFLFHSDPLTDL